MSEAFTLPKDFEDKMKRLLGDEYESFIKAYGDVRYHGLRFNPLKMGYQQEKEAEYLNQIGVTDVQNVPWAEHGFYYEESDEIRPGKHPFHELGLYYIQEPSAMSAAALLKPEPGDVVLDLCAAPGGKTTQLAGMMGQQGLLIANEIHPARSKILAQNVERLGIANAIVTNEDGKDLARRFQAYFDKILVDAPCSGEGMFRKNDVATDEWSLEHVDMCAQRQQEVLGYAAQMLSPGGKMVYSTCTFAPEENEMAISTFLKEHPEFSIVSTEAPWFSSARPEWADGNPEISNTFRLWPHRLKGEGHYVAVLKREGTLHTSTEYASGKKSKRAAKPVLDKTQSQVWKEFADSVLTKEMIDYIEAGNLILFGDQLYRLPKNAPELRGLKIQRAGLAIGTFKKNRFEPSHGLALFLGKQDVKNYIDLKSDSRDAQGYLKGETVTGEAKKGWCLICIDGFSAGWGKSAGNQIKNHYPKGLRKF